MKFTTTQAVCAGLLIGAAGTSGAAEPPGLTIYGIIDTGLVSTTHTGNGRENTTGIADSILGVSNLGFKGSHDLGGGLSAFFNLQAGFNPSTGQQNNSGVLFSRNAYLGVQGDFGSVSLGKQWDLNDDWLVGSVFLGGYNSGAIFKYSEFDAVSDLYDNVIKYVTPAFSGFQGGALMSFRGKAGDSGSGRIYNIGGKYGNGPFYAGITYYHENAIDDGDEEGDASDASYKLTTLGAKYTLGPMALRLGASFASVSGPGDFQSIPAMAARKAQAYEAGCDYSFNDKFKASADLLYHHDTTDKTHAVGARLLGVYSVTPQASVLLNIAYLKNADGSTEALVNTDSDKVGGGYANQNQTSVALGVRYAF